LLYSNKLNLKYQHLAPASGLYLWKIIFSVKKAK
jgi:hypothetical protein